MSAANRLSEPAPSSNGNGNGNSNGRPFRDDLCLAIMGIPDYSLTDCAVLLWVAKRTFWGKAACTCLPSRITRELGGKICIRAIQYSLRRFEHDGLTVRASVKSGPYPNRETALTEKFWETIHAVLADIEPRRYRSASTQFSAPYSRTSTQFSAPYSRTANGDSRFANGDSRFANGDSRLGAPHIEERARSVPSTSTRSSSSVRARANAEKPPETDDDDDDSSSPTQEESKTLGEALLVGSLLAQVRAAWPNEPDLDHRVTELVELAGAAKAALALEYAVLRRVKRFGYTFVLLRSWGDLTAAECAERVAGLRAKRPTPPQAPPPAHVVAKPPSQDVDPVMADLMHQFNRARGPRKAEIAAMMAARSAELEP